MNNSGSTNGMNGDVDVKFDHTQEGYFKNIPVHDIVSLYLADATRVPLLTAKEEVELARKIHIGCLAAESLNKAVTDEDNIQHLKAKVKAGHKAREHLIKANTRLVVSVAQRYMGRGLPFCDLIQEGNLGLIKAIEKFDYRQGYKLSTYATWWIKQNVVRALAEQSRTIRIPVHINDRLRKVYRLSREFELIEGRKPTVSELACILQIDPAEVKRMMRMNKKPLSLEHPISDDNDNTLGDFICDDKSPTASEETHAQVLKELIEEMLCKIDPREAKIIQLRFGLKSGRSYSRREVGKKFGLNRERIRQLEVSGLHHLRHPRFRALREFYLSTY